MGRAFRRTAAGFSVDLPEHVRRLVAQVIDELRDIVLVGDRDDTRRLYPPAYADDPEHEQEYRALVHDDLLGRRLAAFDVVEETLWGNELSNDQLEAWIGALNDARLVLGTRLDISEDTHEVHNTDPDAAAHFVYQLLTYVLGEAVEAIDNFPP